MPHVHGKNLNLGTEFLWFMSILETLSRQHKILVQTEREY